MCIRDSYSYAQLNKIDLRFSSTLKEADLYIDKTQIEKVFYNLLSNAFKYTKPGEWISVELSAEGDNDIVISAVSYTHLFRYRWIHGQLQPLHQAEWSLPVD